MESLKHKEIRVGLFVASGLGLFLFSILLLGGDRYFFRSTYQLHIQMDQVQGLVEGSGVSLSGIGVGLIKKIRFLPDSKIDLVIDIDREFAPLITEGSLASVRTQGALGDKFIYIEPGPHQNRPLRDGEYMTADLSGDIIDLIKDKGPELSHLVDAAKELHLLTQSLNEGHRINVLMSNLVTASDHLNQLLVEGRKVIQDLRGESAHHSSNHAMDNKTASDKEPKNNISEPGLRQVIQHLARILQKIDNGEGSLGALINDPSFHQRLTSMLGDSPRNKFLKPLIRQSVPETGSPKIQNSRTSQ